MDGSTSLPTFALHTKCSADKHMVYFSQSLYSDCAPPYEDLILRVPLVFSPSKHLNN